MTLKHLLVVGATVLAAITVLVFAWLQYSKEAISNEIQDTSAVIEGPEVTGQSEIVANEPVEKSTGLSLLFGGSTATLMNGKVNISFELPQGWRIEGAEAPNYDSAYLFSSAGKKVATITCPIPATGGPYESSATKPVLERSFTKRSIVYEASFSESGQNIFKESVDEEGVRSSQYVGPATKTDFVRSRVSPADTKTYPDMGCLLYQHNPTEEEIELLRSIYHSWK